MMLQTNISNKSPMENQTIFTTDEELVNADFSKQVVILPSNHHWENSPMPGVTRMKLDRIGGEQARATSIVKYEPHSEFSKHTHIGGEEFYVLEGTFSDEYGDYPKGSYVRNPIGTVHTPKVGKEGATIFVKLHQFYREDKTRAVIHTQSANWLTGIINGLTVLPLHEFKGEHTALVRWAPNTTFPLHRHWGGEEIFVIEGTFYDGGGKYPTGSWIRSPHLSEHSPFTKDDGALIYVKIGHLACK